MYLFHCVVATEFELQLVQSTDAVHKLNYYRKEKSNSVRCSI